MCLLSFRRCRYQNFNHFTKRYVFYFGRNL
nr:MAG TPA: hypothetical protein [Caudoviricetes sp.]